MKFQKRLVKGMESEINFFTKKPITVEAVIFSNTPEALKTVKEFCGDALGKISSNGETIEAEIKTLEDGKDLKVAHIVSENDFIIKGIKGEFYACKPDIFMETYEPAGE
jgi:hypothetical protein